MLMVDTYLQLSKVSKSKVIKTQNEAIVLLSSGCPTSALIWEAGVRHAGIIHDVVAHIKIVRRTLKSEINISRTKMESRRFLSFTLPCVPHAMNKRLERRGKTSVPHLPTKATSGKPNTGGSESKLPKNLMPCKRTKI